MWEYKIIDSAEAKKSGFFKGITTENAEDYLNRLGADGWEVIDLDFQMDPTIPGGPAHFHGVAKRQKR
ncbi:DUF4177 domain-containing protein [Alteromonas halophila]|uniref:DUF4177 domain-containing protein n=1 Tax=Alteromonas halophila TaxID=516698 RepID=A0A918MXN1_9ALTE|nr:DUF4177 domain-containing protein [Alteromonas halophila]GGW79646.1 hypothetical protein GCM10007391_10550 [Alteromonas halophila]